MRFKILYDNEAKDLKAAWGFSCLIEDKNILFDTGGDAKILEHNMKRLNIDPKKIDTLVISHEHWDHIGGIPYILGKNPGLRVYILESFSDALKSKIRENAKLIEVSEPEEIEEGIITTGELGPGIKEQSLIVEDTVITGCAHPGIVEIIKKAKELVDEISLVFGGFHLKEKSEDEILGIIAELKKLGVKNAIPCHCSGDLAIGLFKREFEGYQEIYAGKVLENEF
ncbi:MAG: MBL fold metallo-hydrolase [Candidatus Altiarchaeota archaeon]|nr:MBL fold metallo-hydrolase [Candidatus Altiarchaeota archaeon]